MVKRVDLRDWTDGTRPGYNLLSCLYTQSDRPEGVSLPLHGESLLAQHRYNCRREKLDRKTCLLPQFPGFPKKNQTPVITTRRYKTGWNRPLSGTPGTPGRRTRHHTSTETMMQRSHRLPLYLPTQNHTKNTTTVPVYEQGHRKPSDTQLRQCNNECMHANEQLYPSQISPGCHPHQGRPKTPPKPPKMPLPKPPFQTPDQRKSKTKQSEKQKTSTYTGPGPAPPPTWPCSPPWPPPPALPASPWLLS
jgi:hypothetical protein